MSKLQSLYAGGKIASKQHGRRWGGNFAVSKFISSFSPQATSSLASKPPKTSVLGSENILINILINSSLLTLPCSTPAMFTTNKRLLQTNIRALLLRSVESWVGIQITMGYVSIADRRTLVSIWSHNRKRSQTIAEDRTWFYLLRSSAITIARSQRIAEIFAICDRLRSYGNQP